MTTVETLRGARNILRAKKRWAQGYFAFNAKREREASESPDAVCFCAYGALLRVVDNPYSAEYSAAVGFLARATGERNLVTFNDAPERKHSEVVAAFNAAIKLAVAAEKETTRNARLARTRAVRT